MSAVMVEEFPDASPLVPVAPFEPGIRYDLPHEDYLKIDALSASGIKLMSAKSPLHYKWERDHPTEPTEAMNLGTAVHMGVLEPDRFQREIIVLPADAPKRPSIRQINAKKPSPDSIAAIEWWQQWESKSHGKLAFSEEDFAKIEAMVAAIGRHGGAQRALEGGRREVSCQWLDAHYGVPCKARFDSLADGGIAADVKTCLDASAKGFARACDQFKYWIQNGWYNMAHEHLMNESLRAFVFIAVESVAPYGVATWVLESNAIMAAHHPIEESLMRYKNARDSGYWPGYSERFNPLELSRWAIAPNKF
jgi:exodeoxyribonuclease VIII